MIRRIIGIGAFAVLVIGLIVALIEPATLRGADPSSQVEAEPGALPVPTAAERLPEADSGSAGESSAVDDQEFGPVEPSETGSAPATVVEPTTPTTVGPAGLLMFRGNPSRTFYGTGDLSTPPELVWRYPDAGGLCGTSVDGQGSRVWCGTGWTGQPVVWERPDGITEVIFGAYDHRVHFLDAFSGAPTRTPFRTGDIIKGSVTLDPDGFPLLYFGSRDNKLRILALDRDEPTELWSLDANVVDGVWNNDWDSNPVVVDDVLLEGGENSWFFAIELRRAYADGLVTVDPEILVAHPGYTQELLAAVGSNVSIESSPAVGADAVYFANSGGRVLGLDLEALYRGEAIEVFDFWMGDDVDATIVVDPDGSLYVAAELERFNERALEVGQIVKLDPSRPEDPLVWSVPVPNEGTPNGGVWATPALGDGYLYVPTEPGELLGIDTTTGEVVWRERLVPHSWSSPAIVGDTLVVATCAGEIRGYDVAEPSRPQLTWTVATGTGGCIESTPAIWDGRMYVGTRDGYFYAFATD